MTDPLKSKKSCSKQTLCAAVLGFQGSLFGNPALTTCREIKPQQEGWRQRTAATITLKGTAKKQTFIYLLLI